MKIKYNLKTKMMVVMLVIGVLPFLIISVISYVKASEDLNNQAFNQLLTIRDIKRDQINTYFKGMFNGLQNYSESEEVHSLYARIFEYHLDTDVQADGDYDVTTEAFEKIWEKEGMYLARYIAAYGYEDIFLMCSAHGHVMYTARRKSDLGENLEYGQYRDSGLARLRRKVLANKGLAIVDFAPYEPSNGDPAAFVGYPIYDEDSKIIGVLALQLSIEIITEIMKEISGMGQTGEAYLVGSDNRMRSNSYIDPEGHSVVASFRGTVDQNGVDTEASREALAGRSGSKMATNYLGDQVFSAYTLIDIEGIQWALIAEIDKKEALRVVDGLRNTMFIFSIIILVIIGAAGYYLATSITTPIINVTGELNTAIAEIQSAVQQQVSSTKEQAAAAQETSTTMEEINQTGKQISSKAKEVASAAERTTSASEQGLQAVNDNNQTMKVITEQVEVVAENVVSLSEKTQVIEEIITSITDIAEQSNLLALNAAIEAVGAGEHGQRFTVVANEIKKLADQAKGSTSQVKNILSEIQKGINTSVILTEEAVKRVEAGKEKSQVVEKTISALAETMTEGVGAFQQIIGGASQQQIGIDQVAESICNISEAAKQTAQSSAQIEISGKKLEDLSLDLTNIVESE